MIVDGSVWGLIGVAMTARQRLAPDTEVRLRDFASLLATAISNARAHERITRLADELVASRVRVIAAADEARRRIERDLHDGAQQQLVTSAVGLRATEARVPDGLDDLRATSAAPRIGLTTWSRNSVRCHVASIQRS